MQVTALMPSLNPHRRRVTEVLAWKMILILLNHEDLLVAVCKNMIQSYSAAQ